MEPTNPMHQLALAGQFGSPMINSVLLLVHSSFT